ncbi:probable F-box protein at1g60180 [Phtheirospermum japonicum]|uniref:Probable F-box protein at1g60180 n=1 Tax=Phtheirospermum japonicum TaxID=374723 RepID=A0A830CS31_9LAMI|nr:probable F-box protein at1g60180 [Phtheirospermum japonicum]
MVAATVTTAAQGGAANGFSTLHPDIINSHILTRLDGPALASAACCSATLRHLSSSDDLWSQICHSTWPSTAGGARAFFSEAYPILSDVRSSPSPPPTELISAVDIRYKDELIFSKAQKTETVTDWFRCSPFRVDLLEPKDVVPTRIRHGDGACAATIDGMTLSWIVIDPVGRRAANLSSDRAVAARRHWLTGEVQVRYASILAVDHHQHGHVKCGIVVTCGESESGEMQVREVSLEMEDMDGMHLNGKDSLVFLQGALGGQKGTGKNRVPEGQRRYKEYEEMKRERRERKLRTEGALDILCVAFGISFFVSSCCFLLCR